MASSAPSTSAEVDHGQGLDEVGTRRVERRASAAGTVTVSVATVARWLSLASVLARRTVAEHLADDVEQSPASPPRRRVGGRPRRHGGRSVVPPAPHLLGDERQERGEQPLQRVERDRAAPATADAAAASPRRAVGAALDQLDVVVAEPPEERLGALEGAGVVERRRTPSSPRRSTASRRASIARSTGSRRRRRHRRLGVAEMPSTNLVTLSSLMASLRPTFIWSSSNAVSTPGRRRRRPVAHGVGAVLLEQAASA